MTTDIEGVTLATAGDWEAFGKELAPRGLGPTLSAVLSRLKEMGAASAIIEREYLDQDFTAEFSEFYAKLFRRHSKVCQRIHFFAGDVTPVLQLEKAAELGRALEEFGKAGFLGFLVLRPVAHSPIAKAVLACPPSPQDHAAKLLVRAEYSVHVLGATLKIEGVPLVQQDRRIGSCAQATLWMGGRHFHIKHRGPWFSMAQISAEALDPADVTTARSLPAGSSFLGLDNMVRALRAMRREPFVYIRQDLINPSLPKGWAAPVEGIISRYVDSGIPVILGMGATAGSDVGHALLAVGHIVRKLPHDVALGLQPSRAEFCEAFLVNDDQRGSYQRVAIREGSELAESPYVVEKDLQYVLIPLPNRVYLTAEASEKIAWDLLNKFYADRIPGLIAAKEFDFGQSENLSANFLENLGKNKVIARTYLTYGWKYRERMLRNECAESLKAAIIRHALPKYVWVTEFGTLASLNSLNPSEKRVSAHAVVDATSSELHYSQLIFHGPGLCATWSNNSATPHQAFEGKLIQIKDDKPYYPKVRGLLEVT